MNGTYPQQPGYPPQSGPPRPQGTSCFIKGCLVVVIVLMLLGVIVGAIGWYTYQSSKAFLSATPVPIRVYPATDAQFQEVNQRTIGFVEALNAGKAATLALSADDLNILIARDPECKGIRGKVYLSIVNDQLIAECNFPMDDKAAARGGPTYYLGGKAYVFASFAGGEFTLLIKKIESLDGKPAPALVNLMVDNPDFSRNFSRSFNESFRDEIRKNSAVSQALSKLRTIVIKDNRIVFTAMEGEPSSKPLDTPAPAFATPVASPAATE